MSYLYKKLQELERLDALIRRRATGNANVLAEKFCISKRSVYNMIDELKYFGAEIHFSRCFNSFIYTNCIKFQFSIVVDEEISVLP